jgi:glycosyltransferase involved in cell wall biosynthesis
MSQVLLKLQALHPDFDPAQAPPKIAPLDAQKSRPLWSVMIPTFNCAGYLEKTLRSVLEQDPGVDQMQIEVIDDCSTQDDPAEVVRRIAGDRVSFFRKPINEGAISNFNTCIERSQGHLVHILHGDDHVMPGFYSKIEEAHSCHPQVPIFATLIDIINEAGEVTAQRSDMRKYHQQVLNHCRDFRFSTCFQFAGVVIRRSFYEQHGGFNPRLVHCADWEMWTRATHFGGAYVIGEYLAAYRVFSTNDTSRLRRTAENLRDQERAALVFSILLPDYPLPEASRKIIKRAKRQAAKFKRAGDIEAVHAHQRFLQERAPSIWETIKMNLWKT